MSSSSSASDLRSDSLTRRSNKAFVVADTRSDAIARLGATLLALYASLFALLLGPLSSFVVLVGVIVVPLALRVTFDYDG